MFQNSYRPILILFFFLTACSGEVQGENIETATTLLITATLPATSTPHSSESPLPSAPQPTIVPVQGFTLTQLNIRAEPSTASDVLGIIPANSNVQILGRDIGENWWQIIYETSPIGTGWVTAQYVNVGDSSKVPVVGGEEANSSSKNTAVITQQLNVRSGPGTGFNSVGVLNVNDVITMTGRNEDGTWLQLDFPAGPDRTGWVSGGFVNAGDTSNLPIISEFGGILGTGTPAAIPQPPTPTIVPAQMDFDTPENPLKTINLGDAGTHTVLYNGDVSSPTGDTDDWFEVTVSSDFVFLKVQCHGIGSIQTEIIGAGISVGCNETLQAIPVKDESIIRIHIQAIKQSDKLEYTQYILTIKASP